MSGSASAHEHLRHDLQLRRAERLRRLDVAIRHAGNRRDRVRVDERHAGDEDEHHLLRLVDPEPQDRQRNQRRDRQVAAEQRERRAAPLRTRASSPATIAERHADERSRGRSRSARAAASRRCSAPARARSAATGKLREHLRRARQDAPARSMRSSATAPEVANHHSRTHDAHRRRRPTSRRVMRRRRGCRSASSDWIDARVIYFVPAPPPPGRP